MKTSIICLVAGLLAPAAFAAARQDAPKPPRAPTAAAERELDQARRRAEVRREETQERREEVRVRREQERRERGLARAREERPPHPPADHAAPHQRRHGDEESGSRFAPPPPPGHDGPHGEEHAPPHGEGHAGPHDEGHAGAHGVNTEVADALVRFLKHRRPELAERLAQIQARHPGHIEEMLMEVLTRHLQQALRGDAPPAGMARLNRRAGPDAPPVPDAPALPGARRRSAGTRPPAAPEPGGEPRGGADARPGDADERFARLRNRHLAEEERARDFARELRGRVRDRVGGETRDRIREELRGSVRQDFELRTEMRRVELERIERELDRLRRAVDEIRRELEVRARERDVIIDRRVQELLEGSAR